MTLLCVYVLTDNKVSIYKFTGVNYQRKNSITDNKDSTTFQKQGNVDMQNTRHTNKYNEYYK